MKFEIKRAKNGYILEVFDPDLAEGEVEKLVFQEHDEDERNEIECFADFLRTINENYGPSTSRYSPARIHVIIEPGDKWEPKEK